MGKGDGRRPDNAVEIQYSELGTIAIDELTHAVWEDIQALKEIYHVSYVTGARLIIPVTNEYGDPRYTRHPEGHRIYRMDTHHYRPACKDYEL
jgi:hypothetical protein